MGGGGGVLKQIVATAQHAPKTSVKPETALGPLDTSWDCTIGLGHLFSYLRLCICVEIYIYIYMLPPPGESTFKGFTASCMVERPRD